MVKKVDQLDYYGEYCIQSTTQLNNITDSSRCIKQDIRIYNKEGITSNPITTLGNIKEIHGHLNIDEIEDLGDLKIVKSHFWYSGKKLKTLNKLERVNGELNLRYSNVKSLGNLKKVNKKLSLRDSKIENLGSLEYVGGDLFLPKRIEDINLDGIEIKGKVRYWNDVRNVDLTEIHELELELESRQFTGRMIVKDIHLLNDFIQRNITDFYSFLDSKLDDLYDGNNCLLDSLYDELKKQQKTDKGYLSHEKFYSFLYSLPLQSQNEFRVSKGVPEIGEGWVSETELYYLLKGEFYNEEVIHHGKPKWLGRQHVDIWFPKYKIGIEYQGLQHDQPVEFFGGEESFIKGQQRDLKKKKLFKENNSILIEVRKEYNIEDVVNEIKKNIT